MDDIFTFSVAFRDWPIGAIWRTCLKKFCHVKFLGLGSALPLVLCCGVFQSHLWSDVCVYCEVLKAGWFFFIILGKDWNWSQRYFQLIMIVWYTDSLWIKSCCFFSLEFVKNNFISRLVEGLICDCLSGERKTMCLIYRGLEGCLSCVVCLTADSQQTEVMEHLSWSGVVQRQ